MALLGAAPGGGCISGALAALSGLSLGLISVGRSGARSAGAKPTSSLNLGGEVARPSRKAGVRAAAVAGTSFMAGMLGLATSAADCAVTATGVGAVALTVMKNAANAGGIGAAAADVEMACSADDFGELDLQSIFSLDPNEKVGPYGSGEDRYLAGDQSLNYSIYFENLNSATAPAQEVVIIDTLDLSKLDLNSFSLGDINWGSEQKLLIPPGLSVFHTEVDLRPDHELILDISANLNKTSGVVKWIFTSEDPKTGELTENPFEGFLPPNVTPPEGEGRVNFTIFPSQDSETNSIIDNNASIFFDLNEPINTNIWSNIIDNTPPASSVSQLEENTEESSFLVSWQGTDIGSGIKDFSIYVSQDGGDFEPWIINTTDSSSVFESSQGGIYAFYSIARDLANNVEKVPQAADAFTSVIVKTESKPDNNFIDSFSGIFPNPTSEIITIKFESADRKHVNLELYDALGRKVAVLINSQLDPGKHTVLFDISKLASGVYLYSLRMSSYQKSGKFVVVP